MTASEVRIANYQGVGFVIVALNGGFGCVDDLFN